jgi:hypothetical protein
MSQKQEHSAAPKGPAISLDTWAVAVALGLALLVRVGVIHRIPW